jgi:hypothetical protein
MSKEGIGGKIKTILKPEEELEELNEKRKAAPGIFISQAEIEEPTDQAIKKVEGLLNAMRKRFKPLVVEDPHANDRRFGPK